MRLLLIEDNPDHALLVRQSLRASAEQIEVVAVDTLGAGVARLGEEPFDVILLDMHLPDGEGIDALRAVENAAPDVAVLVLTSHDDVEAAQRSLQEGAQDYLVKDHMTTPVLVQALCFAMHRQQIVVENRRLFDDLASARALLERKNRRLRKLYKTAQRFVDNVSHEFRTPLTVIKEYASLVREGVVGEVNGEQDRMLNVVEDRADDLNTMVDDMLDSSKLHAGVMGLWRKECSLVDVVDRIRPALQRKAEIKGVRLEVDADDRLPRAYCDDEKIGRIINNLVGNAIKFSGDPGEVRLSVRADERRSELLVNVADNGPGIGPRDLRKIFKRFKQVGGTARGSCKGFGLGLSIARELVELNFGEMSVSSTLGRGSTFSFTVPLAAPGKVLSRYLDHLARRHRNSPCVSLLAVDLPDAADADLCDDFGSFLAYYVRPDDLLLRISERRWLLAALVPALEIGRMLERLEEARQEANRNRPNGPLPEMSPRPLGSWPASEGRSRILASAGTVLDETEVVCA